MIIERIDWFSSRLYKILGPMLNTVNKLYSSTACFPNWIKRLRIDSICRHVIVHFTCHILRFIYRISSSRIDVYRDGPKIIVSLTSIPKRIDDVWLVLESLLRQTCKPDKIIIYLSSLQFPSKKLLPKSLLRLESKGIEIRLVEGDLRSHKKYQYAFKEFPNDYVMLADDDILYPSDTIEQLMHDMSPQKVHCSYGSLIRYDKEGKLQKYIEWTPVIGKYIGNNFFFGSGGGTLLMPSKMHEDTTDIDKALTLTPLADDIWLNTMARLAGLKIEKVRDGLIFPISVGSDETLSKQNVNGGKNDIQISNICSHYPCVFKKQSVNNH